MVINFLYITENFPPSGMQSGIRALEISKRLIEKEVNPFILTKKINRETSFNNSLIADIPKNLKIFRTHFIKVKNKYLRYIFDKFLKLDFYIEWLPFAYFKAKKIIKLNKIDFIYTYGPPFYNHLIGFLLKLRFKIPLVIEYGDPWSFNPYHDTESKLNKKINIIIEQKIIKSADIIVGLSSEFRSFLKEKFPLAKYKRIISISTGLHTFDRIDYSFMNNKKIVLTFAGALYGKRNIIPFFKIISELKKENFFYNLNFNLKIFGYYNPTFLKNIIKILNIGDLVKLGGLVPRSTALNEILKSNLAVHIGENLNYPFIAFKVWDYLSCRKKIIYLGRQDSYTSKFLQKYDLGIILPINNISKGKENLRDLLNSIKTNNYNYYLNEEILKKFSWDKRVEKFIKKIVKIYQT